MKVLILGAGPAGLFAAQAAVEAGCEIIIMSKYGKSFMRGAQYLHRPIPGLSAASDRFLVTYVFDGDIEVYREKVYGPGSRIRVSPESLQGVHDAWDIRTAYDRAWERFGNLVLPLELSGATDEIGGLKAWCQPDLIVSTVPAPLLCTQNHTFSAASIWATDKAYGMYGMDNVVICDGHIKTPWYRKSSIHGFENTEYPEKTRPPVERVWEVIKPIHSNCTCYPDVIRLGRYGLWEKGVLSDGAYYSIKETLESGSQEALF
jgi:hypothetical protein